MSPAGRPDPPQPEPCQSPQAQRQLLANASVSLPTACVCLLKDVVGAVFQGGGVQHLISMATSEHVIMQNEALVALTIAAATDIGTGRGGANVRTPYT